MTSKYMVAWKSCAVCEEAFFFKSPYEFCSHLREKHCTKEGGSFVCQYGHNQICPSLPLEGVSDQDYEDHVAREHVADSCNRSSKIAMNTNNRSETTNAATVSGDSKPSVVEDQYKWTVYMSSVNLPAVLNDPRLAKRDTAIFSKTWGEGFERAVVKTSHLPHVSYEHFKGYLDATDKKYKLHTKNQSSLPIELPSNEQQSSSSGYTGFSIKSTEARNPELDIIPKIFFLPTFNLENSTTFNGVLPWNQIEQHSKGSSRKLLQEKLSHYLDLVEMQLARQISQRSEHFFSVMSSQHELEDYLSKTCTSIKDLRAKLKNIDHKLVNGPLKMMRSSAQRANYIKLYNKLKLMSTVHQTQPTLQLLLSTNEFVGALDLIATTQDVLTQELPGVHCFRHLSSQLSEMEKAVVKMMEEDFVSYVTADFERAPDSERTATEEEHLVSITLGMLRQSKFNFIDIYKEEAKSALSATLKKTLADAVADMDEAATNKSLGEKTCMMAYDQWLTMLINVFDNLLLMLERIKVMSSSMLEVCQSAARSSAPPLHSDTAPPPPSQHGPDYDAYLATNGDATHVIKSTGSSTASLSQLDSYNDDDTTSTLSLTSHTAYTSTATSNSNTTTSSSSKHYHKATGYRHHQYHHGEDNSDITVPTTPISSITASFIFDNEISIRHEDYLELYHNVQDMLCFLCDRAHERCSRVLTTRDQKGFFESLSALEFLQLSRAVEHFTTECEKISGRKSSALRSCLQSQANRFVNKFHEDRKNKLALIIDNERWKQADVPADFQALVDHIEESGTVSLPKEKNKSKHKPAECIIVGGESYAVVGTVLMLWKMIVEYCSCVEDFPYSCSDILTKLVELLQIFNSRTCQLILGAGAIQLVGLKTITARNLALASRCLQLILHYLPFIRKHFELHLPPKQLTQLKHLDNIIRDYDHHIAEVSSKFLTLMDNAFDKFLEKWEVKPPMPSPCFKNICERFRKFYESINDLLPRHQMATLCLRIHESLKNKLRVHLIRLCVLNDAGPQHSLVTADIAYYMDQMKSLPGIGDSNDDMSAIWDKT